MLATHPKCQQVSESGRRFNTFVSTAESNSGHRSTALGYALLAPSLFGVVAFLLLPILVVVWLSLHRWDLLGPIEYVGS
ncbi:MAG: multiple sugar transport system permease protein, partial [Mycobacterium sp.]|nr:multiple sugar transport system permease protein [Mycobacterium sp.]